MKRTILAILVFLFAFGSFSCGHNENTPATGALSEQIPSSVSDESGAPSASSETKPFSEIDVDLTKLSSTMVYSEVYNILSNSQNYLGKVIRIKGIFSYYADAKSGNEYYSCIISDATACCSQGLEFVLGQNASYPEDYPEQGTSITVTGVFETYMEEEILYCRLARAELTAGL